MNKTVLRNYARLIARKGINVKKGQEVLLYTQLDQPEFVKMLTEECYRAGAGRVRVEWSYDPLVKLHARWQTQKKLSETTDWERAKLQYMVDTLPARIYLESSDPDGLEGIAQPKYSRAIQARATVQKPYRDAIEGKHQWCIAAVPGEKWAKKMYPDLRKNQAIEQLWKDILSASRADGDAVAAWDAHNRELHERCEYLNSLDLRSLHYKAQNGTDFTVGLIPGAQFLGGSEETLDGVEYNPNIPSEEIFITPMAGKAEGIVYSTKPLSFMGQLIENFSLRFENGRVTEVKAEKNEALLQEIVKMDERAAMLGECALIPKESPISASGLLFYSTLFDENASCHLALGDGFENCIPGYEKYTREQLTEMGINSSIIHEDFMIGCDTMDIDGISADGRVIPIFRGGTWAF